MSFMRLLSAVIIGLAIILASVIVVFVPMLMTNDDSFNGLAIDSGARIDIEMLNQRIEDLELRIDELTDEITQIGMAADNDRDPIFTDPQAPEPFQQSGPNVIIDAYAQVVLIANRREVNQGLEIAGPSYLARAFGPPRENLSDKCETMTNSRLADKLVLEQVGPIRVQMLQPAIDSLRRVMENINLTDPDLYARINTAGALCVRQIRGTRGRASTHAFGLAVDLNIDGVLDTLGDGKTQLGLTILADFFRSEGWVWGAAWGREDSMHFEVSRQKLDEWIKDGLL
jgi:hypothetical protein